MCNTWKFPSNKETEFSSDLVNKIPSKLKFINITGGEPFLRDDLEQIIKIALTKTRRLVVSTNGYFTNEIIKLTEKYGNRIGVRISIEGLPKTNDELRGMKDGFDRGLRTLIALYDMGIKDIGFGITVSDKNAKDMIALYHLANSIGLEFATATTHNSFYFHKNDNRYKDNEMVADEFENIAAELLKTNKPKNWFRSYFNMGLANKVKGGKRPLPCKAGTDVFFLDPYGHVLACNGSERPWIMGNLKEMEFDPIWNSSQAEEIRRKAKHCKRNCWMVGTAVPAMRRRLWIPFFWIIKNKFRLARNREISLT
jgi:MoaA/NifB/PqqE/SkfB family radical SAM enzyme